MRILVFGFDAAESSQIRRIRSLMDVGHQVDAFTMRRRNMNPSFVPFWTNVHLYEVANEKLAQRLGVLLLSLLKIARHLAMVRRADVVMARNFDLLLLARAALLMTGRRTPLIYECLDIHGAFTDPGWKGRMFRAVERALLRRVDLVVVSSPGFVDNYFRPVQRFAGPIHLMENKIWLGRGVRPARPSAAPVSGGRPWVVGWVGSLRCEPSFTILTGAAERLGERVRLALHGNVHSHVLPDFEARLSRLPNVTYHGPYPYPDGLGAVYGSLDLVWAQDLWQRGANSDWLLPNRIYEASYFGCLSIAVAGTQTARTVAERSLGLVLQEASSEALVHLIEGLEVDEVTTRRGALLAQPSHTFVYSDDDVRAMLQKALSAA